MNRAKAMLEKCILARHKAGGGYLRCNYLNKLTKIVLWLVGWTQLTTWIVGINLVVSKTFCLKKKKTTCIYYATCIICKFVLPIWFPLHSEEVSKFLNELWGNESMYISDHPDFSCRRRDIWPDRSICMQQLFICLGTTCV